MPRVLIGMSGGVDSSVSAMLLKEQGYEVIGATMKLWCGNSKETVEDAKRVCNILGIRHEVFDLQETFKNCVVNPFIEEYWNARTPNPCIQCNKELKFGSFYKKALELGCDYISTGHYASTCFSEEYKRYVLKKSKTETKDQTYFLYGIPKEVLGKMIFPLENYHDKDEIRRLAKERNLPVASKPDSQEICFIHDNNYIRFLQENSNKVPKQGNIVDENGTILGKHKGLIYYTIGQRKGLGIAYKEPLYVVKLDPKENNVIVGTQEKLYQKELYANELNWLLFDKLERPMEVKAKIRYRAKEADAIVYPLEEEGRVKVIFKDSQRAITPGQSVVFYQGDMVVGGGKISE